MTFREGLIKARSSFVILLGMLLAASIVIGLESWDTRAGARGFAVTPSADIPRPRPGPLSATELGHARTAWRYFQNNLQPATGLVNSVDNYPASTMWDTGSYLVALVAAHRLELIDRAEFDGRLTLALRSLARMPLFDGALPNKSYNTVSLETIDYNNRLSPRGIGWSAIDVGRLLVPFNMIVWNHPEHTALIRPVIARWRTAPLVRDGVMYGAAVDTAGKTVYWQEGRLGYEQYSARSFGLLGLDVTRALRYEEFLQYVPIYGIDIPTDRRRPEEYGAHNSVLSEPYVLDGLEFGGDTVSREFAYRVYRVQEERFKRTGVLTAVTEDHIDQPPYFVYNAVFTGGRAWHTITESGEDASRFKTLSVKAAFGWDALYRTAYTARLMERVAPLHDPARGFWAGLYESSGTPNRALTANTNAVVLETLYYRKFGPFLRLPGTRAD
jgi:Protein of unknown function (DUF3131)